MEKNIGICCSSKIKTFEKNNFKAVQISSDLTAKDILGRWKARWNIGRMSFKIAPGLYKIGDPDSSSPVFISSNYKMSFDILRKNLKGIKGWIIVLETYGINVWCAAGKGTFGTDELVRMINKTKINEVVDHKRLIVPQLGAPGISAHEVKKRTGLNVIYGPVRSSDIHEFLRENLIPTPEMRKVTFTFFERLVLAPTEFILSLKYTPFLLVLLYVIDVVIGQTGISVFYRDVLFYLGAILTGTIIFPIFLPFIPFRSFALKGCFLGIIYTITANLLYFNSIHGNLFNFFTIPVLISFLSYNFTGSSTYTNLSGVEKELKISLPIYAISLISGVIIMMLNFFGG